MQFCTKCGKQLPDAAAFCAYCGARFSPVEQGENSRPKATTQSEMKYNAASSGSRGKSKALIIAVGCIAAVILLVVIISGGDKNKIIGVWQTDEFWGSTIEFTRGGEVIDHGAFGMSEGGIRYKLEGNSLILYAAEMGLNNNYNLILSYRLDGDRLTLTNEGMSISFSRHE